MQQYGAATHVGNVRENNEDSYVCDPEKNLWIVADGMGGLGFGEVASAIATHTVTTHIQKGNGVNQAIELAHQHIRDYAESVAMGTNMGTTLVLLISQGSLYNLFWAGDSRAYLMDDNLSQITVDHSLVQTLIDRGELTAAEAESDPRKNAVTRALGVQELDTVRADSISDKWKPNQKILLCSDGLSDLVPLKEIESVLAKKISEQEMVNELISKALRAGGKDNITVVIVSAPNRPIQPDQDTYVPDDITDSTDVRSDDVTKPS